MDRPVRLKQVLRLVIATVVVIALVFAAKAAVDNWDDQILLAEQKVAELQLELDQADDEAQKRSLTARRDTAIANIPHWSNLRLDLIALSGLLYGMGLVPAGLVLAQAVRNFGCEVSTIQAIRIQLVGHLGKYVPGKAMVVVIRAERLSKLAVPVPVGTASVFIETLLMMAVGSAVAGLVIWFLPVPGWIGVAALVGGVAATIPTIPPIFRRAVALVVRKVVGADRSNELLQEMSRHTGWGLFCTSWIWQVVSWCLIGASFSCVVMSIPGAASGYSVTTVYLASLASIALAMVVGFVSLLPGGAGIRELVIAIVLAPIAGASHALVAAILARLIFLIVEVIGASLGSVVHRN